MGTSFNKLNISSIMNLTMTEPYTATNGMQCYIKLCLNNLRPIQTSQKPQAAFSSYFVGIGDFCGYVVVKDPEVFTHLKNAFDNNCLSFDVHGNVTLCREVETLGTVIGFDCAHGEDNLFDWHKDQVKHELESFTEQLEDYINSFYNKMSNNTEALKKVEANNDTGK